MSQMNPELRQTRRPTHVPCHFTPPPSTSSDGACLLHSLSRRDRRGPLAWGRGRRNTTPRVPADIYETRRGIFCFLWSLVWRFYSLREGSTTCLQLRKSSHSEHRTPRIAASIMPKARRPSSQAIRIPTLQFAHRHRHLAPVAHPRGSKRWNARSITRCCILLERSR